MNAMNLPPKLAPNSVPADDLPTYDARALIANGQQARVMLDGQSYFLRITRAGKLILTK